MRSVILYTVYNTGAKLHFVVSLLQLNLLVLCLGVCTCQWIVTWTSAWKKRTKSFWLIMFLSELKTVLPPDFACVLYLGTAKWCRLRVCVSLCACRYGGGVTEKGLQNPSAKTTHSWWAHRGQYTLCVCVLYTLPIWKDIHYSRLPVCPFKPPAGHTPLHLTIAVTLILYASAKILLFPNVISNKPEWTNTPSAHSITLTSTLIPV